MDPSLQARVNEAYEHALALGLDPGAVRFVAVNASQMYDAASTGLPGHWSHWSSGRDYWISKAQHDAGMSKIYEMVVPTDPALALLMDSNPEIVNVMVAAHVFGHTHLDRANAYFADRNRTMLSTVSLWAGRIEGYEEEHGDLVVEAFIDKVLSLEPYADARYKGKVFAQPEQPKPVFPELSPPPPHGSEPEPEFQPNHDLFAFLAQYAEGLEDWQRDILGIYRNRMLYFLPMVRCKVLHEGFAALTHRRIMERMKVSDDEWVEYSKLNSGVMSPHPGGSVNPYWMGHAILEDIEKREGWEKVLEVVAVEDDASLVRNYLTEDLCEKLELFSFRFHSDEEAWIVDEEPRDWETIRDALALEFSGGPTIQITDFDADGKRALMLTHRYDGRRLDVKQADAALAAIADIWGQRVCLSTRMKKGPVIATAWAPSERSSKRGDKGVGVPTDWQLVDEDEE
jgi:stage V sporulation protein R